MRGPGSRGSVFEAFFLARFSRASSRTISSIWGPSGCHFGCFGSAFGGLFAHQCKLLILQPLSRENLVFKIRRGLSWRLSWLLFDGCTFGFTLCVYLCRPDHFWGPRGCSEEFLFSTVFVISGVMDARQSSVVRMALFRPDF